MHINCLDKMEIYLINTHKGEKYILKNIEKKEKKSTEYNKMCKCVYIYILNLSVCLF